MRSCLVLSAFLVAAALCLAALGFFVIQASPATEEGRRAAVAAEATRTAQDLAERQKRAEQNDRLIDAWIPAAQAAGTGVILALPVAVGLAGWVWLRHRREHHREFVHVADGAIPMPRARLLSGAYDDTIHADTLGRRLADVERARNPVHQLPANLRTYAPRYGNAAAPRIVGSDPNAPALAAPPEPTYTPAPSFGELLQQGWLGPGKFALGWDPAKGLPAFGSFGDLYSVALLGATGSGKSTTARALISQTALNGGKLIVIDPHLHAGRDSLAGDLAPLSSAFLLPPVDDDPAAVKHALEAALDLLSERKAGATGPVVLVVCDEWTSLVGRGGPRAELLTRTMRLLAVEGRKLGLHGMVCLQDATKEATGPLRDVLSSAYVHRSRPQHARMVAPGLKVDTWQLQPGQAWLDQVSAPPRLLTVPECTPADVAAVGRLLLPAPSAGPRTDSARWGTSATYSTGGEPLRAYTPPPDPPAQTPLPPADGRTEGRKVDADDAQSGQNQPAPSEPTDRPTYRPPTTLTGKARAAGMPLSPDEWDYLARVDRGQSPQTIARDVTGQDGGRRYSRVRDEVARLADMVRNWPDGEQWADGSEGNADA